MLTYRLTIKLDGNNFIYPVPDVNKISGAKYRGDMQECAVVYPDALNDRDVVEITQAEYDAYGFVNAVCDKTQLQSDGIDTATITTSVSGGVGQQLRLLVDGNIVALENTDTNGQAIFSLIADVSMVGTREMQIEADLWKPSKKMYLEVI